MNRPDFRLQWQEKLPVTPRQGLSLAQGVTANAHAGLHADIVRHGVNNTVFALDNDTGFPNFVKRFEAALPTPTAQCPGGMTGALTRVVNLIPTPLRMPAAGPPERWDIVAASAHRVKACRSTSAGAMAARRCAAPLRHQHRRALGGGRRWRTHRRASTAARCTPSPATACCTWSAPISCSRSNGRSRSCRRTHGSPT